MSDLSMSNDVSKSRTQWQKRDKRCFPVTKHKHLGQSGCCQETSQSSLEVVSTSFWDLTASHVSCLWGFRKSEHASEADTHRNHSLLWPLPLSGAEGKALDDQGRQDTLQKEISVNPIT